MKMTPELLAEILWLWDVCLYSTVQVCILYCIHIVHHSADRALSFLFRLSMGHMSAQLMTTVENPVPSPLLQYNSTYSLGTIVTILAEWFPSGSGLFGSTFTVGWT